MYKLLLKGINIYILVHSVFGYDIPLRGCNFVETYLEDKDINYNNVVTLCENDDSGNILRFEFTDHCLSNEIVDGILSSSIIYIGYSRVHGCPLNSHIQDLFADLPNLQEIYVYGAYEQFELNIKNIPKTLKTINFEGISYTTNDINEISKIGTLENLLLSSQQCENVSLNALATLPNFTHLTIIEMCIIYDSLKTLKNVKKLEITGATTDELISAISYMSSLEELQLDDLYYDNLNLEPLKELSNLYSLSIICPASKRNHKHFSIKANSFKKLKSLKKLSIRAFNLSQNNIDEISSITGLNSLIFQSCDYNPDIINYDSLANLTNLQSLSFINFYPLGSPLNPIPQSIFSLINLKQFSYIGNKITTIPQEILKLINLEYLDLNENEIAVILDDLNSLSKLKYIDLSFNPNLTGRALTNTSLEICKYDNNGEIKVCKPKELSCLQEELQKCEVPIPTTKITTSKKQTTTKKITTLKKHTTTTTTATIKFTTSTKKTKTTTKKTKTTKKSTKKTNNKSTKKTTKKSKTIKNSTKKTTSKSTKKTTKNIKTTKTKKNYIN